MLTTILFKPVCIFLINLLLGVVTINASLYILLVGYSYAATMLYTFLYGDPEQGEEQEDENN